MTKPVIFIGDIHGEFKTLIFLLKRFQITDSILVQVGDFGVGFTSLEYDLETLSYLNKKLCEFNCIMYAMRGNHDDPRFFSGAYQHTFSNLSLLPDYTVLDIEDRKFLFVGGAISVDRIPRIERNKTHKRLSYWKDEGFVLDRDILQNLSGIDVVVTHNAPNWCEPITVEMFTPFVEEMIVSDPVLRDDVIQERNDISEMFNILNANPLNNIKLHVYGHFHKPIKTIHNGCVHHLLNINEFKML